MSRSQTTARASLAKRALVPLPVGAVRPAGWLRNQLRIQADGLSGHLDEFWPDIARSGWIGGDAEGWERGPYWLDGLVPLAVLLSDERLMAKAQRWIDEILARQRPDGWLGPVRGGERYREYDPWPQFVVLKALSQYHEATGDKRIIPAMLRAVRRIGSAMEEQPLYDWARFRWADLVLSLHWLYERCGLGWLLEIAGLAHAQGYDWRSHFAPLQLKAKATPDQCNLTTHVVNTAMGFRQPGVWYRQSWDASDRSAAHEMLAQLHQFHGQANGMFSGDEHLAGRNPSQGTELCAVVEMMYSLEVLLALIGDPFLADRLERIAYNALPATFKPDMWAHQYDQQANQVFCRVTPRNIYTSNGPDANIFGLAPNYGCCTANMHQGWPKFAAQLWMRLSNQCRADGTPSGAHGATSDGLAAVAYAPCRVDAKVAGTPVSVDVVTSYPFDEHVQIIVTTQEPVKFALMLRTPGWARGAACRVEGSSSQPMEPGAYHRVSRTWEGVSGISLTFPMDARLERRFRDSATILRGPLAYGLRIGEEWHMIGGQEPHADWEVYPTSPWNYGLLLDPDDLASSIRHERRAVGRCPFSPEGAPVRLRVRGRRILDWIIDDGAAGTLPASPVTTAEPLEELTLIPYGSTNLRVTEFPVLSR